WILPRIFCALRARCGECFWFPGQICAIYITCPGLPWISGKVLVSPANCQLLIQLLAADSWFRSAVRFCLAVIPNIPPISSTLLRASRKCNRKPRGSLTCQSPLRLQFHFCCCSSAPSALPDSSSTALTSLPFICQSCSGVFLAASSCLHGASSAASRSPQIFQPRMNANPKKLGVEQRRFR